MRKTARKKVHVPAHDVPRMKPPVIAAIPDRWVIVRWSIDVEVRVKFVRIKFASYSGGFEFVPQVTHAQTWNNYAAARKYLRSKKQLLGCQVLNYSLLERITQKQTELELAEEDRKRRLGIQEYGDRFSR